MALAKTNSMQYGENKLTGTVTHFLQDFIVKWELWKTIEMERQCDLGTLARYCLSLKMVIEVFRF